VAPYRSRPLGLQIMRPLRSPDGLFLSRHMPALREGIALFLRRFLVEILATTGTEPVLPPIPALKEPLTAQTGGAPGSGRRGGGFTTHG
jgi:hypothetical protein